MRRWYALLSKPKKEVPVVTLLSRAGIETYLPLASLGASSGRQAVLSPFFPSYLFASLDPEFDELHLVRYTRGVRSIVGYGGEPSPVPDELIDLIKLRIDAMAGRKVKVPFQPGDRIVISNGPLAGTEAIFDRQLSAEGRVQVLVQILHRLCRADVSASQITMLRKAAAVSLA